jgi:hypothetical protein
MTIIFFLLFTPQQHIDEHRKIEKKELVGEKIQSIERERKMRSVFFFITFPLNK